MAIERTPGDVERFHGDMKRIGQALHTGFKQFDDELQGMTAHQVHEACRMLMREIPDNRLCELADALKVYKAK